MKIGVFGGTFDPPHFGHLIVAEYVREQLRLDRMVLVPSWISPHKLARETAPAEDRLEMLGLLVKGRPGLDVSDLETRRRGISYTVETLRQLKEEMGGELYLLVGADNYAEFGTWRDPEDILRLARLVVMTRPGSDAGEGGDILRIRVPEIGISSTAIREKIREGKTLRHLVPESVADYITAKHLYGSR